MAAKRVVLFDKLDRSNTEEGKAIDFYKFFSLLQMQDLIVL